MKKFTEADEEQLILLYKRGFSHEQIAKELDFNRRTITVHVGELRKKGLLPYNKRAGNTSTRKNRLVPELKYKEDKIIELYKNNVIIDSIAKEVNLSSYAVAKILHTLFKDGKLEKRKTPRTADPALQQKRVDLKGKIIPSTLPAGQTIMCTEKVARTCVYGCDTVSRGLCDYIGVTGGQSRAFGKDGCSWRACTKYSQVSKSNPKARTVGEVPRR